MPIDGNNLLKKLWDGIITFLTAIVETKAPDDIELAVWVWILIISLIGSIFAGIFAWLKKR